MVLGFGSRLGTVLSDCCHPTSTSPSMGVLTYLKGKGTCGVGDELMQEGVFGHIVA